MNIITLATISNCRCFEERSVEVHIPIQRMSFTGLPKKTDLQLMTVTGCAAHILLTSFLQGAICTNIHQNADVPLVLHVYAHSVQQTTAQSFDNPDPNKYLDLKNS